MGFSVHPRAWVHPRLSLFSRTWTGQHHAGRECVTQDGTASRRTGVRHAGRVRTRRLRSDPSGRLCVLGGPAPFPLLPRFRPGRPAFPFPFPFPCFRSRSAWVVLTGRRSRPSPAGVCARGPCAPQTCTRILVRATDVPVHTARGTAHASLARTCVAAGDSQPGRAPWQKLGFPDRHPHPGF